MWDTIKRLTNTSKTSTPPTELISIDTSPKDSCNEVNRFFINVGKTLAQRIQASRPPTRIHHSPPPPTISSSFVLLNTDPLEVETTIMSLRSNAATGWDSISSTFLKRYVKTLAPVLCHIFNLSFQTGIFPSAFKKAIIHPIFKNGDKSLPTNYRPIAVLSSLSKIFERIINKNLTNYLEKFNIISPRQFGFRKRISTSDATLEVVDHIVKSMNSHKKILTIFLDLAKAFDTVPTSTLLSRLNSIGVRGTQLDLFRSFLEGRSQYVKIGQHVSDDQPNDPSFGLPQGSTLSPTLFLIFINPLCQLNIQNCVITSFADDTTLSFTADNWDKLQTTAQNGFNLVVQWLQANSLTLNASKTKFIPFSISPRSQPTTQISLRAHSCNTSPKPKHQHQKQTNKGRQQAQCQCPLISSATSIKYLGILIDNHLNFKPHINLLTSRVRKLTYIFKTLRFIATASIIKTTYLALCQSIISYCIPCWGGAAKTLMKTLEVAQRKILKVAINKPIIFPTAELYKTCGVLSVRKLYLLNTITTHHRRTPYTPQTQRRKDRICSIPPPTSAFTKRQHFFRAPYLYNKINKIKPIFPLSTHELKKEVTKLLMHLTYDETETFMNIDPS